MKQFSVYKHPTLGFQAVKQGFCWPAFFFSWIWAFICKMWGKGFFILAMIMLLTIIETVFENLGSNGGVLVMLFLQIGFFVFVGSKGNEWREKSLIERGFQSIKTVDASTSDSAIGLVASDKASD
ncbi:DUF2628 domain-containing protein, partial [Vibrio cholerae]|nr:DUF2628 domain-containing protein [Vibrio cholerae]